MMGTTWKAVQKSLNKKREWWQDRAGYLSPVEVFVLWGNLLPLSLIIFVQLKSKLFFLSYFNLVFAM